MELSRRDLVKLGLLGSASLYLPMERLARTKDLRSLAALPKPYVYPFVRPADLDLRAAANGGTPRSQVRMAMRQLDVPILGQPGQPGRYPTTPLWAYTGPRGEVNPTIHVDKGQPVEITHVHDS
jgi:spore coat protein A, manganese oxidase